MKYDHAQPRRNPTRSLPARGVWIEIESRVVGGVEHVSLPARGVGIEINPFRRRLAACRSLPARGVWIEIVQFFVCDDVKPVSLPARGVWIEIDSLGTP